MKWNREIIVPSRELNPLIREAFYPIREGGAVRATERAFERARVIWPLFGFAVGDGELTQDLLYRPPIERKLSDEPSSNRLDTILVDLNSDCRQPHDFALPLPMPLVKAERGRHRKRFVNHRVEPWPSWGMTARSGRRT